MKKYLLLAAFGSLLGACSAESFIPGPELALSPSYKQQSPARGETIDPTTQWWANFGDSNLNRLIEEALAQNLSIEQARERIKAARFTARIAKSTYLPQIDADGSVTKSKTHVEGQRWVNTSNAKAGLSGSWLLDYLGAKSTAESQRANIEQQKAALNTARLDVIAAVASSYLNAQGLGRQIAIAQKSLSVQNDTARITTAKLDAGTASALDSTRAKGAAALTAADIPTLQQAREQSINQIAILLGKEPVEFDTLFTKYKPVKLPRVRFSNGIPADLLRNRPDVREAEWALKGAVADIGVAEADLYPSISLSGSLTASIAQGANVGTQAWSFGPSVSIPIFDRGRIKANIDLSKSSARLQYLAYRQTVLLAVQDVEDAMIALRSEQRRNAQLAIAVSEYSKAEALARQLNDAGTTEFSDVLDAQSLLYSAQLQYASSSLLLATNYVDLCQALGGGWDGDEPLLAENTK